MEAITLRYYGDKLNQTEAADEMGISQTTYSRIINRAFEKITKGLVEGLGIAIQDQTQGRARGRRFKQAATEPKLKAQIVFDGFGCQKCGFQWIPKDNNSAKPECPECGDNHSYRLIKKGPTA